MSTLQKNAICKINQKHKASEREQKCSEKGMKKCYEVMKSDENHPLSTYKKKKMVMQIQEILGSDTESHVEVLSTILKKAHKCPIKRKLLQQKQILIHEVNIPTPEACTPVSASVNKTFRKIALLRSKKKNEQAKTLCEELKSNFNTIKQIATITKENVRFVYRLLSSPRKGSKLNISRN